MYSMSLYPFRIISESPCSIMPSAASSSGFEPASGRGRAGRQAHELFDDVVLLVHLDRGTRRAVASAVPGLSLIALPEAAEQLLDAGMQDRRSARAAACRGRAARVTDEFERSTLGPSGPEA